MKHFGLTPVVCIAMLSGCVNRPSDHDPFAYPDKEPKIIADSLWRKIKVGTAKKSVINELGHAAGFDAPFESHEYRIGQSSWVMFMFFDFNNALMGTLKNHVSLKNRP